MDKTPAQIMDVMEELNRQLWSKNKEYLALVKKRAEAEREYNMAVAKKALERAMAGEKMAIIDKIVKGSALVSSLKLEYETALGVEKACIASMRDIRSAIDSYRSFLSWKKTEAERGL